MVASTSPAEPIAIVGSGCRFPGGANSPSSLWKLLEQPRDLRQEIHTDRFSTTGFYHPDGQRHGSTNVRHSYLLDEDVRVFDAAFFNISPNEAEAIDPQQRLLLETVYEALEAGGHPLEALRGSNTSVYVGTMTVDYHDHLLRDHNTIPKYFATGINRAIISNRVSYFFDWHGPSMTIDTACSSSLIAVHQGVQSLRSGESRVSVACGTQVLLGYDMYIGESNLKMLSPNGRSRMWDADADGYARGEGVAAVVMKRLSDAIADGDHIECIVRETGANQDGFSNGITVPSTEAQAALISQTYAKAGLDPEHNPDDRPQYFEAHGTGTQAGDPKEASAIYRSFGQFSKHGQDTPLYVGSIKTIIGHLEGAAGLAGLLKASASLQNGHIAPNLSFQRLNPKIEPFYHGLKVPTDITPWPALARGVPRRASVNSFGFGGANAHAILEQHVPRSINGTQEKSGVFSPFVYSAQSEASLVALLEQYSQMLKARSDSIDLADLAWTLHSRRSQFATRVAFSASSVQQLSDKIDAKLGTAKQKSGPAVGTRFSGKTAASPCILGVFTGQGAQWPAMGAELIRSSPLASHIIQNLEDSLAALPSHDRPSWSLREQMLAGPETSRIAEAALSQPLCTAVQVVLVDLLKAAGVTFSSVVGHSSGEIGAAYAAGLVSASDAIRIAYYRGLYAKLAGNKANGQKGAMLAAGLSWDEAQDYVDMDQFRGRISIAANNSSASVTIAGDADAIAELKELLDEQKKFARALKVDTAYHSHHMYPCGDPYVAALRACGVKAIRDRKSDTKWFSSVTADPQGVEASEHLQDEYWRANMTNAVLFADAVKNAVSSDENISIALEIGPHPALKGPAMQTIADIRPSPIPYSGVLSRGNSDIEAFADGLGSLWTVLGAKSVDLASFDKAATRASSPPKLVCNLPSYQWDHRAIHWSDSHKAKKIRSRKEGPHELLGVLSPESNARDMRWSNILKVKEIPWLEGHQLQGIMVFPAAGYIAMAIEACRKVVGDKSVELFELQNLSIPRAIIFEEGNEAGVETLATLTGIAQHADDTVTADFSIYSAPNNNAAFEHDMELVASGNVKILLGDGGSGQLPANKDALDGYNMTEVDPERVYDMFNKLGYGYTGPFRTMTSTRRKLNQASALIGTYAYSDDESTFYLVHPTWLDVAIQSSMLAYSSPGDGRLWSLHVPTSIGTVRVDPTACQSLSISGADIPICNTLDVDSNDFVSSIDILSEDGQQGMIQVEDLVLKPFAPATAAEDRCMYSSTKLDVATPDVSSAGVADSVVPGEAELAAVCERIAFYYLRKWHSEISHDDWNSSAQPHHTHVRAFVEHVLARASNGQCKTLDKEWASDSFDVIEALVQKHSQDPTVRLLSAVGQQMPSAVRNHVALEEYLDSQGLLDDFYSGGSAISGYHSILADTMKQLTHRYPHAKILEIGAGRGAATKSIIQTLTSRGGALPFYTLTDASQQILTLSADIFDMNSDHMSFKVLDIEQDPAQQGFEAGSFDIIVASNALSSTSSIQQTLDNVRQLLKAGGHLIMLEQTDNEPLRFALLQGRLASYWAGVSNGRRHGPGVSSGQWHTLLRKSGFGGVDTITTKNQPFAVLTAQAVDERVSFLRRPLSSPLLESRMAVESLVILGNESLESSRIAEEVQDSLYRFCDDVTVLGALPTEQEALELNPLSTIVNLVDLDSPIFKDMTQDKMDGLRRLFESGRHILWVTRGARAGDEPFHAASLAFCRSLSNENAHISIATLDVSSIDDKLPKVISEQLLRQVALDEWDQGQLLWSKEPETFLVDGKLLLPRIFPNMQQNSRLNATRRVITNKMPVETTSGFSIHSEPDSSARFVTEDVSLSASRTDLTDVINVSSSSLAALGIANDAHLFASIGKTKASGELVLALATTNSSSVAPVASVPIDSTVDSEKLLLATVSEILAKSVLERVPQGSSLVVSCSAKDRAFAAALSRRADARSTRLSLLNVSGEIEDQGEGLAWIHLDRRAPLHVIRSALRPLKATHFLDMASSSAISDVLPPDCRIIDPSDLAQNKATSSIPDRTMLLERFQDAVACARASVTDVSSFDMSESLVKFEDIKASLPCSQTANSIVSWPETGSVEVEARPLQGYGLFAKHKTYVLFGLSGQVGQSLCEWMVTKGAGCVILTSRRAKVDQRWLDSFQGSGATVKALDVDVTNRDALEGFLAKVKASYPPIAGVVNGANVLSDGPFSAMSVDSMLRTLGPKVTGSYNLDQAFYDDKLDFFVMLSSISCVIGTAGQSNYTAANGYMNGLARQRRRRGLAASALDIGLILGIGVAEAAGQSVIDSLQKYGITPLSEPDLRLAFAESIIAGYLNAGDVEAEQRLANMPAAVMTSGLRTISSDERDMVWYNNPIFSHLVIDSKDNDGSASDNAKVVALPVKEQIALATTEAEALEVLKECFATKLRIILQSGDAEIPLDAPLVELGLDSLSAVEIRSWFLKSLKVDVPVLKLVGGSSICEVCELAFKKLPEELVSSCAFSAGGAAPTSAPASSPAPAAAPKAEAHQPQQLPISSGSLTSASSTSPSSEADDSSNVSTPSGGQTPSAVATPMTEVIQEPLELRTKIKLTPKTKRTAFEKNTPISVGQSRFWFLRLLVEDPSTFNVTLGFRLKGSVRVGDLERAVRVVTSRHESLRTCFVGDDDEADRATQGVLARSLVKLERRTIKAADDLAAEYKNLKEHQFDLASGPLLRVVLATQSPTSHYLLFNYHHIIMDMASFQILTLELDQVYNGKPLGPPPRQFTDFSVAQWQALEKGELKDEFDYWKGIFPPGEQPPVLSLLPMARSSSRVALSNYAVHQVSSVLDPALGASIKSVARSQRCTPFHFYLAAFKAMLFAFTQDQDLTIGIADANRNESDVIGSIGFFLNLLTLRFHRQPKQSFADAVVEARNTAYGALGNSRLPFDVLLKDLGVARSSSHSPFFQAFFDYRQQTSDRTTLCNCSFDLDEMHPGRSAYDISLDVADLGSEFHVTLRTQTAIYDKTAAKLLLDTYLHFVQTLAKNTSLAQAETPLFSQAQLANALSVGLGPDLDTEWPATLPHRIDQMARENPDKTALADGLGSTLSYAAMTKRIESIAEALLVAGVDAASRVLVYQQASTDWICSLLAIMRIGGVYVPLDLRNPIPRLAAQAEHCQAAAVLADGATVDDAPKLNVARVIDVSRLAGEPSSNPVENFADADSPAAILYTSGSTGTPKGIVIRHSGICKQMEAYTKTYDLKAERVLQQSAFTFDFSIDQIFTGLSNGGMLFVVPMSKRGDPLSITEIIKEQAITYTKVTPSEYSMWIEYGGDQLRQAAGWRFAFGGGEPMTKAVLSQFTSLDLEQLKLHNSYGPAEISIASHKGFIDYRKEEQGTVACGFSLPNYATYILDKDQKPLPVGMPGEVVIGGPGVSLGYLANDDLTSRVFVANPYANRRQISKGWTRMHRTGDIGHLNEDGSLVFRNRVAGDTQVKMRGLRIDLSDIENNILATADGVLKHVVVTMRESSPDFLVAHVVFASDDKHTGDRESYLKNLLSRVPIPQYMVPVMAIPLPKLPLTKHNKVDRRAIKALPLPQCASPSDQEDADAELTETMVRLRQVWRELLPDTGKLGLAIAPWTDFFLVGGNSLLVVRLQSRIRQTFNVAVRLVDLLNASSLGQMARQIEDSPSVDVVDWDNETAPPAIPSFLKDLPAREKTDEAKHLLITGATGNLAKHVLPLLAADARVASMSCIIRDKPRQGDLFFDAKVSYHIGDLSLPLLGLGVDEFVQLAKQADSILHLGAVRSFWDNYHMLRPSNVEATKELVKLASAYQIPIHFVSTSGILSPQELEAGMPPRPALSEEPATDGSNGYVATKWASERVLERSAKGSLAVPSSIYRLLPVDDNYVQPMSEGGSEEEVLDEFVRCADLAGTIPDMAGWEGRMHLIPAKLMAKWLAESVLTFKPESTIQYSHYRSSSSIEVAKLDAHMEQERGHRLEHLHLLKWMGRIKALGFGYILSAQEATLSTGQNGTKWISRR